MNLPLPLGTSCFTSTFTVKSGGRIFFFFFPLMPRGFENADGQAYWLEASHWTKSNCTERVGADFNLHVSITQHSIVVKGFVWVFVFLFFRDRVSDVQNGTLLFQLIISSIFKSNTTLIVQGSHGALQCSESDRETTVSPDSWHYHV